MKRNGRSRRGQRSDRRKRNEGEKR